MIPLAHLCAYFYNVEIMNDDHYLGEFEQLVLLSVLRLGEVAYGMSVRSELLARARRDASIGAVTDVADRAGYTIGAVYSTLDRLQEKGLVTSRHATGPASREGRARRLFQVSVAGRLALERVHATLARMTEGLDLGHS